jgi:hypothetical protein
MYSVSPFIIVTVSLPIQQLFILIKKKKHLFLTVLGIKLRALHMLGMYSTTELHPLPKDFIHTYIYMYIYDYLHLFIYTT